MPRAREEQSPVTRGRKNHRPLWGHCSPRPAAANRGGSKGDLCQTCAAPAGSPSSDPRKAWPAPLQFSRGAAWYKTSPRISRPETGARFRFRGAHVAAQFNPAPNGCMALPPALSPPTNALAHRAWPEARYLAGTSDLGDLEGWAFQVAEN